MTATDMMHSLHELRNHIEASSKQCEIFTRYPLLLRELSFEDLLLGKQVFVAEHGSIKIPGVDPVLFNALYYLMATNKEVEMFQLYFPGWDMLYLEGFSERTRPFPTQILHLVFDVLHTRDSDNCYPLHIMISELIASSSSTDLMGNLSRIRKCASPSAYFKFKNTMAAMVKDMKLAGNVPGLVPSLRSFLHLDNLEQYQRYSRNPTTALKHSLVIGIEQPNLKEATLDIDEPIRQIVPRNRRPSRVYHPTLTAIPAYSVPEETSHEKRQCKVEHFTYNNDVNDKNFKWIKTQFLHHAVERIVGSTNGNQVIPSLKEVLAWDGEFTLETNSIYLELIPDKPDSKDTLLYALDLIEKLFVKKLGYEYVVICGDGLTVNLFYQRMDMVKLCLGLKSC